MSRPGLRGSFRIIGGEWRRRRLDFVTDRDVRPSPDRVRETLFNWLAPVISGAHCLDLFAGSGALGLEALSRGAASVVFVDHERAVIDRVQGHLDRLGATARARIIQSDAQQYLTRHVDQNREPFDLVFLDPPFRSGQIASLLSTLEGHLAENHRVYIESESPPPMLPPGWETLKSSRAGQVSFALVRFSPSPHTSAVSPESSP